MSETKETRIASANEYIRRLNEAALRIRYEPVRSLLKETASAIGNLRDAQYLGAPNFLGAVAKLSVR